MKKQFVPALLVILLAVSCNNANDSKVKEMATTDSIKTVTQTKPDSISGYAPVNGLSMYYEIHGNNAGVPLVLIHGGGSTIKTTFANILPLLSQHYTVIGVELQAHGHTRDRDKPSSFEQDADDVAALLEYLKIKKANLFGFSNGGSTALQIAIRHPALVNKLVAVAAVYKRDGMMAGFFDFMQTASLENMPAPLQTEYLAIPGNNKNGLQAMHDRDKNRMLAFKDWPEKDIAGIKAPALLIVSDKDVVTVPHTLDMSKKIPNATLVVLPGVHGAAIGEICTTKPGSKMPGITVDIIKDFLDN